MIDSDPPIATPALEFVSQRSELAPGDRLGNWTLRAELGSGGMGRVFLAERSDGHYEQRVAIKLLLGWTDDDGLEMLARERRILATLQHPNIARLIDGGTTPMGHPYLVMDYVQGVPLHVHCKQQRLDLAAVVALFQQVLQAVAAAHRQLVVHCDLKPGNVLVTDEGRAMLLDFGIARLQGPGGSDTLHDHNSWTPRYASPEQQRGGKPGVASDIYSLGVMFDDLLQLLKLSPVRRREAQAIAARASQQDPDARYASVPAFAADLRRLLAHRPLEAMPRRWPYVAAKLLRRRWAWSLAALLMLGVVLGFTVQLVRERDRARAAESRALAEAAATRAVSDFVVGLFQGADPAVSGAKDMAASELVERGRRRVDLDMSGQPALQAAMKAVLAQVFDNIGRPGEAITLYTQAAELEQRADVARPQRRAQMLSRLAVVLANEGRPALGEAPAREALALAEAEDNPAQVAEVLNTLGIVQSGLQQHEEAVANLQRALALRRGLFGEQHEGVAAGLHNLGLAHRAAGRWVQAEQVLRQSLTIKQALLPATHPSILQTHELLGRVLNQQRRFAEAEGLFLRALAERRELYGEVNEKTASVYNELANVLHDSGRVADALPHYRDAVRIQALTSGVRSMQHAVALNNLATALEDLGQVAEAGSAYRESLNLRRAVLPAADLGVARGEHNLGRFLMRSGQLGAARPLIEAAAAARAPRLETTHRDRLDSTLALAELAAAESAPGALLTRLAEVEPHAALLTAQRQVNRLRLQARLAALQGQRSLALQRADEAVARAQAELPPAHPERQRALLELARAALDSGDSARARSLLQALAPNMAAHEAASAMRQQHETLRKRAG